MEELDEMQVTNVETLVATYTVATHIPTATWASVPGNNRMHAKLLAYADVATQLNLLDAAARYETEAAAEA